MKVFEIDWGHEKDWVAAENTAEALDFYSNEIGEHKSEIPEPKQLSDQDAKNANILDIDVYYGDEVPEGEDPDDYSGGYKIVKTFFQAAKEAIKPEIIATTAF